MKQVTIWPQGGDPVRIEYRVSASRGGWRWWAYEAHDGDLIAKGWHAKVDAEVLIAMLTGMFGFAC